jgi:hypothetical protein
MARVSLTLSVHDPDRFLPALEHARQAGLTIERSFEDLGVASGSIEQDRLPLLRRIQGLIVEDDRVVAIPRQPRP